VRTEKHFFQEALIIWQQEKFIKKGKAIPVTGREGL
jgi:hypothetical protein